MWIFCSLGVILGCRSVNPEINYIVRRDLGGYGCPCCLRKGGGVIVYRIVRVNISEEMGIYCTNNPSMTGIFHPQSSLSRVFLQLWFPEPLVNIGVYQGLNLLNFWLPSYGNKKTGPKLPNMPTCQQFLLANSLPNNRNLQILSSPSRHRRSRMIIAQNLSWRSAKVIATHIQPTTQVCNLENCQPATIRGLQGSMGTGGSNVPWKSEAEVLKKLTIAGLAQPSRLRYPAIVD